MLRGMFWECVRQFYRTLETGVAVIERGSSGLMDRENISRATAILFQRPWACFTGVIFLTNIYHPSNPTARLLLYLNDWLNAFCFHSDLVGICGVVFTVACIQVSTVR